MDLLPADEFEMGKHLSRTVGRRVGLGHRRMSDAVTSPVPGARRIGAIPEQPERPSGDQHASDLVAGRVTIEPVEGLGNRDDVH